MENIILREAIEIIKEYQSKNVALRIALFGPPESGKTDFLENLIKFCNEEKEYPIITFYVDLKKFPTSSINDFYKYLFKYLENEIKSKQIKIEREFPLKWDIAFENLVEELLKQTQSDVYFFIDHIDAISFELARILVSRFKEFDDKIEIDFNYKRLGLCIAGIKSLFELRRAFSSPFISCNVIKFPRQDKKIQDELIRSFMRQNSFADDQLTLHLDNLRELSGGETSFLKHILKYIEETGNYPTIGNVSELLNDYFYNSTVLQHIALRFWSDLSLQQIIRDLVEPKLNRVLVNGSNPEIDEFQLSGALIATHQNFYRFRNELVKQFLIALIQYLDNPSENRNETLIPRRIIELEKIVENCEQTLKFSVFLENLEKAWKEITDYHIKSENILIRCFAAYQNDDGFWLIQNKPSLEVKKVYVVKDDYEIKINEIIKDWKISPIEWFQKKHTFFQWTDKSVTFIYTLKPGENALFGLSVSVPINQADEDFTEFKLGHWIRFIKRYREKIIQFILQEIGEYSFKKNNTGEKQQDSEILDKPNDYFVDKVRNTLYWTNEDSPKFLTTPSSLVFINGKTPIENIADVNNKMRKAFDTALGNSASFKKELSNIYRLLYLELTTGMSGIDELCKLTDNSSLCVESYTEGLKIPFELIPFRKDDNKDYLTTRIGISRRLRFKDKSLNLKLPFHLQFLDLQQRGEPFRVLIVADDNQGELTKVAEEVETVMEILQAFQGAKIHKPLFVNSIEDIEKALSKEEFHLLHFCGHTQYFSDNENKSGLTIRSIKDETNFISYGRFAQVLKNSGLWLVYLSCCYGAPTNEPEIGQTYIHCIEALVREGIPNVIGFRWAVEDVSAIRFAEEFYKELFEKNQVKEVNMAMLMARRKLWNQPKFLDVVVSSLLVSQTN